MLLSKPWEIPQCSTMDRKDGKNVVFVEKEIKTNEK